MLGAGCRMTWLSRAWAEGVGGFRGGAENLSL